uniref:Mediator of RNA polymerase II transcription subunit 13 n=1 Tax=Ciona savignyi TaxID=51511 RepID=H2Z3Q5_CIOSA
SIVVYLLDPFNGSFSRGLWHCFRILQKSLPKPLRDHIIFQIVPIEHVLRVASPNNRQSFVHAVRSLSFSTFAQCRRILLHEVKVRSMTGFGPAAGLLGGLRSVGIPCETRLYTPPYVLSIPREPAQAIMKTEPPSNILFVTYCVSHNQKFVLVSATDQSGELLETCCINIDVPPRLSVSRKHRVSVRSEAIDKMWKFCVATVSRMSTTTWRIVIGRLGRLSHGEIRDWGKHLHRRSLLSCSRRASCTQCKLQQCAEGSFIISACLTSLEPDGALMLMPGTYVVQMNNFGRSNSSINQSNQLRTPEDISCTHIYVFPTSADTQLPGANFQTGVEEDPYMVQPDAGERENDNFINDIMGDGADLDDIMGVSSSTVSHQPLKLDDGQPTTESSILPGDPGSQEDVLLSQQPLALGYMVSTAPPGPLPAWFWSTCPYAKNRCPVFLRSALHIQSGVNDATTHQGSIEGNHPLDSNKTAVVLRFVLENYNALSWLTTDPVTKGRRSCLPVHCLSLMQLYHTVRNLL